MKIIKHKLHFRYRLIDVANFSIQLGYAYSALNVGKGKKILFLIFENKKRNFKY
jgi:hypothetical protein